MLSLTLELIHLFYHLSERQQQKALKEVQALGRLDHSYVIRYFHTWIETPPLGWQKAQDDTYDWRDISR